MRDVEVIKETRDKYLKKVNEIRDVFLNKDIRDTFDDPDLKRLHSLRMNYLTKLNALNFVLNEDSELYNRQDMLIRVDNVDDFKNFIVDYDENKKLKMYVVENRKVVEVKE